MRTIVMNQETTAAAMAAQTDGRDGSGIGSERCNSRLSEYMEELVGSNPEARNWKGVGIAVMVILSVIGLVILSVILLTPENNIPVIPKVSVTDVVSERWKSGILDVTWQDSSLLYQDADLNVVKMRAPEEDPKILVPGHIMKDNGIFAYKVSADNLYALLMFQKTPIYTYSFNATYYLYDVTSRTKEPFIHDKTENMFQYASFGPGGSQLLYSLNGDLYYKPEAGSDLTKRLTSDGRIGSYQNGIADWLYEEEILKVSPAFWWSPNGRYLAFASFDDKDVADDYVTVYNDEINSDVTSYGQMKYKYPKAGLPNPVVNIHVVNLETMDKFTFDKPAFEGKKLKTFQSLTWQSEEVMVTWSDRIMERSVMQQCSMTTRICEDGVLHQTVTKAIQTFSGKPGWLQHLTQTPLPSDNNDIFFYILPSHHGGMGEYHHLAVINKTAKPTTTRFLTSGNWEVTKLLRYDAANRDVYYISNEAHPGTRHVYRINIGDCGTRTCITCAATLQKLGDDSNQESSTEDEPQIFKASTCGGEKKCLYYDAEFGNNADWCVVKCLGPCIPYTGVIRLRDPGNRVTTNVNEPTVRMISPVLQSLSSMVVPLIRYDTVWNGDTEIKIKALIPASIHVGERPVVFFKEDVGSQNVDFKFRVDLASYIVTTIGAVAVFVDGRGTAYRGNHLMQQVAGRLGALEIDDMKAVLEFLKSNENIDTESVGIVGTSGYGGYTAALALTDSKFRCGVARSPVTDWKLYDSFGSERLLGSPSDNPLFYQKSNLIHRVEAIRGSQLRIFHGLQDRKVNMQHSVLLEQAAMLSNLPPEAVQVRFHPSADLVQTSNEAAKIEAKVCESISFFLRNCLFGHSEEGRLKLDLLNANYGIESR